MSEQKIREMKAVMIIFNQTNTERVEYMLDKLEIRGFSWFSEVRGRGSKTGEPRMGTHTWPEMNSAALTMIPDEKVDALLDAVKKLDQIHEEVGVRAFVWNVEKTV
jgi:nitrogen regulatory protein PII